MKGLFQIFYTVALIILKGFVLSQLWGWFITPIFGLPLISFTIGIGIVTMVSVLLYLPIWDFKDCNSEFKYNLTIGVKPVVLYFLGWIVHFFI